MLHIFSRLPLCIFLYKDICTPEFQSGSTDALSVKACVKKVEMIVEVILLLVLLIKSRLESPHSGSAPNSVADLLFTHLHSFVAMI